MEQNGEVFKFPITKAGLEWFPSLQAMRQRYRQQFQKLYGSNSNIKRFYVSVRCNKTTSTLAKKMSAKFNRNVKEAWRIRCDVCTNTIVYVKFVGSDGFTLATINYFHIHTHNREHYIQYLSQNTHFGMYMREDFELFKPERQHLPEDTKEEHLVRFLSKLSTGVSAMKAKTKFWLMKNNFGIDEEYFEHLLKKVNQNFDTTFQELINRFEARNIQYTYLPSDLLSSTHSLSTSSKHRLEEFPDSENPSLPNILLVVTPEMKTHFQEFGSWVGFDLTFSIIRERTASNGEYMIGFFLGTNASKRIIVFGLVVTNSQSVFAYSWIFREFFRLVGSTPAVVVTDEQKAIHYALRELIAEGTFKGKHLFDVFHILRKFRRGSYQSSTFQSIRKLINAKDKLKYRRLLREAMGNIANDKQLELLRSFDLNSQNYSYSQIGLNFVGIGVSNSPNEYFHSYIKNHITHASNFTKVVQIILDLIQKRQPVVAVPVLLPIPYPKTFNLRFMHHLTNVVSDKAFYYTLKELSKAPVQRIFSQQEQDSRSFRTVQSQPRSQRNEYYVQDGQDVYLVYRQPRNKKDPTQGFRWSCLCQLEPKAGYLCSHLAKVLLTHDIDISHNIAPRWKIDLEQLQNPLSQTSKIVMNRRMTKKIYNDPTAGRCTEELPEINPKETEFTRFAKTLKQPPPPEQQSDSNSSATQTYQHSSKLSRKYHWSKPEQTAYIKFLAENRASFLPQELGREGLRMMSRAIGKRSELQCSSHHKYMLQKYGSVEKILENFGYELPSTDSKTWPIVKQNMLGTLQQQKPKHLLTDDSRQIQSILHSYQ